MGHIKYKIIMANILKARRSFRRRSSQSFPRETREQKILARTNAVFGVLNQRLSKMKPASKPVFDDRSLQIIRSKVMPRVGTKTKVKVLRVVRSLPLFKGMSKRQLVQKVMGSAGEKLGIMLVNPEMFPFSSDLKRFLNEFGCEVIYSKNLIFSKSVLYEIYEKELREIPIVVIKAANLLNAPSKVLVFRQLSAEELIRKSKYLQRLQATNREKYYAIVNELKGASVAKVFDALYKGFWKELTPGTIRADIVATRLDSLGMKRGEGPANQLDAFGFFRKKRIEGRNPYTNLTGIHTPASTEELFRNAETLLTKSDLIKIVAKL